MCFTLRVTTAPVSHLDESRHLQGMLYARSDIGVSVAASVGSRGVCPLCGCDLRPKCGKVYAWHWAHFAKDCDPWGEPEGPWHRAWKEVFTRDCREVSMPPHRADIRLPSGRVIELQHSTISVGEIRERESFYRDMLWIFDAGTADIGFRDVNIVDTHTYGATSYDEYKVDFECFRDMANPPLGKRLKFQWRRAKPSILQCHRPVFLDLSNKLLLALEWSKPGVMSMYGTLHRHDSWIVGLK